MGMTPRGDLDRAAESSDWPITVVAHWRYPGYNRRDMEMYGIWLIGSVWVGAASFVTRGEVDPQLVVIAAVVVAYLVWPWVRRRPAEYEMVLEPERLLVRDASAGTPEITMARGASGELFVAEAGFDWRERWLSLRTGADRDVVHIRAGNAAVRFSGLDHADDAWWDTNMPPGDQPADAAGHTAGHATARNLVGPGPAVEPARSLLHASCLEGTGPARLPIVGPPPTADRWSRRGWRDHVRRCPCHGVGLWGFDDRRPRDARTTPARCVRPWPATRPRMNRRQTHIVSAGGLLLGGLAILAGSLLTWGTCGDTACGRGGLAFFVLVDVSGVGFAHGIGTGIIGILLTMIGVAGLRCAPTSRVVGSTIVLGLLASLIVGAFVVEWFVLPSVLYGPGVGVYVVVVGIGLAMAAAVWRGRRERKTAQEGPIH